MPVRHPQLQIFFPDVNVAKPKSSRNSSVEAFVVARGFALPDGFTRGLLHRITTDSYSFSLESVVSGSAGGEGFEGEGGTGSSPLTRLIVPFVACGDLSGYDADANYALDADAGGQYVYHEPPQKPTTPAYRAYLEAQQAATGSKVVLDTSVMDSAPVALAEVLQVGAAGSASVVQAPDSSSTAGDAPSAIVVQVAGGGARALSERRFGGVETG